MSEDEECKRVVDRERISKLKPVFGSYLPEPKHLSQVGPGGTITVANSSKVSDGAAGSVLASKDAINRLGLTPLAKILGTFLFRF